MKTIRIMGIGVLMAGLSLTSCNKDDEPTGPSGPNNPEPKSFTVRMTDAPGDYYKFDVEIESVQAFNASTNQWVVLSNKSQIVSVLDLTNGKSTVIASESDVEFGNYTKVRLNFGKAYDLHVNANATVGGGAGGVGVGVGVSVASTTTWDGPTSVDLNINSTVNSQNGADVLIDFDVAQSVIDNGNDNYSIDPSMRIIADYNTGVQGKVMTSSNTALTLTDGSKTYTSYANSQGEFYIQGVTSGTYTLIISAADDNDSNTNETTSVSNVSVVEGEITQMGSINLE